MYCPGCKCEFRAGFSHCETCDLDLVEDLTDAHNPAAATAPEKIAHAQVKFADYCGFFSMEEARAARDHLRGAEIRSEIVIRERPDATLSDPIDEEYWLRVDVTQYQRVNTLLEQGPVSGGSEEELACEDCGATVDSAAPSCPGCGARFDDE